MVTCRSACLAPELFQVVSAKNHSNRMLCRLAAMPAPLSRVQLVPNGGGSLRLPRQIALFPHKPLRVVDGLRQNLDQSSIQVCIARSPDQIDVRTSNASQDGCATQAKVDQARAGADFLLKLRQIFPWH